MQAGRRGDLGGLREGGLGSLVVGVIEDHPEEAEQVSAQPWVGRAGGERAFQPVLAFLEEPAGQPEVAQRPGQPRSGLAVLRQGPAEGGAEVVVLAGQDGKVPFPLREREERLSVPPPGGPGVPCLGETAGSVLADRLQQPVPGLAP